jgi:uncharacterized protein YjbI with pentapeptide repeats
VEGSSSGDRWGAKPITAGLLRAAIVLAPLVGSSVALLVTSHLWRAPSGARGFWYAAMAAIAFAAAVVVERLARRLLPLAQLLRLTMLFPDQAPSRLRLARSAGTTGQHLERLARSDDDTAQVAAEKVLTLITALSNHDRKTRGHSERVRLYSDLLGEHLRLPRADRDRLRWAALLHDIGKLEIAPTILNKPAKLSDREFARVRRHPTMGAEIAAPLLPWLGEWGAGIVDHHERWDGHGYPNGRVGTAISRAGRIVCLVDAFETMTAARVYKKAMTTRAARIELASCAGTQFDPDYVRAFLAISLPKVLWAMGPVAFIVQLPFLRSLAKFGSQATQLPIQGASTASVAAAASVLGVVTPAVVSPHGHHHAHIHSANVVAAADRGRGASAVDTTTVANGSNTGAESVSDSGPTSTGVPSAHQAGPPVGGVPSPGATPGSHSGHGTTPGGGTTGGGAPGSGTPGSGTPAQLTLQSATAYLVANQSGTVDVLTGNGADLDASTLTVSIAPSHGTATVGADGSIAYKPAKGFHGVDQLSFQVCDVAGECGSAGVTLNVLGPDQAGANYSGVDFAGMDLQGFDFANATLSNADFSGANLTNVNFRNADLSGADLSSATVASVDVNGADLSGANLSGVTRGSPPTMAAINLTATIGAPITIDVSSLVSDPNAPIDWSTLQITGQPAHGTAKITGPHTIVYTPAAGLISVNQMTISVANVLTFGTSGTAHIAVVL